MFFILFCRAVAWWAVRRYEHSYWAAWVRKKVTNRIER